MIHVSVIGAGPMGSSIAGELATNELKVKLYDAIPNKAAAAVQELDDRLPVLHACGVVEKPCLFSAYIKPCETLRETVEESEIVFEAVVENLAIKRKVFSDIARYCSASCVIATNSLTWSADDLSKRVPHPERTLGVRFLHPVFGIRGVEMSPSVETSAETRVIVESFLESLGKRPFYPSPGAPRYVLSGFAATTSTTDARVLQIAGARSSHVTGAGGPGAAGTARHGTLPVRPPPASVATARQTDYEGPGGPGALGSGERRRQAYSPHDNSNGSVSLEGLGGPGALGTGHVPSGDYPVQAPTSDVGPGGPGALGTVPLPSGTGSAATDGPVAEGPGGPGAYGTGPETGEHVLDQTAGPRVEGGPGGPGARGTGAGLQVHGMTTDSGPDKVSQTCVVCMDARRNALLAPCHHFCVCTACALLICQRQNECPVCRTSIKNVIPVYVP